MAKVEGIEDVNRALSARIRAEPDTRSVIVGYTQSYAVYVHENLDARHAVGQAKYLEQPARLLAPELARQAISLLRKGVPLERVLLLLGLRIQRESQLLVPVLTGALKGSAFTRYDE